MGGIRGDLMAFGLIQTTIMEIDKPRRARRHVDLRYVITRSSQSIVTVSNTKIFDEPVLELHGQLSLYQETGIHLPSGSGIALHKEVLLERSQAAHQRHQRPTADHHGLGWVPDPARDDQGPTLFLLGTDRLELILRFMTDARAEHDVGRRRPGYPAFDAAGIALAPDRSRRRFGFSVLGERSTRWVPLVSVRVLACGLESS